MIKLLRLVVALWWCMATPSLAWISSIPSITRCCYSTISPSLLPQASFKKQYNHDCRRSMDTSKRGLFGPAKRQEQRVLVVKSTNNHEHDKFSNQNNTKPAIPKFLSNLWRGMTKRTSAKSTIRDALVGIALYLCVGTVAYAFFFTPHCSVWDALYFSVTTFTTVGYGDLASPPSGMAKLFTCLFGLGGIAFLSTALASIGSNILETELNALEKAQSSSRQGIVQMFDKMNQFVGNTNRTVQEDQVNVTNTNKNATTAMMEETKQGRSLAQFLENRVLFGKLLPTLLLLLMGGLWMGHLEHWSLVDSMYYSIITAGTVGYGDYAPTTIAGRIFGVLYIPFAVAAAGEVLGSIASSRIQRQRLKILEQQRDFDKAMSLEYLNQMDTNGDGKVTRDEYVEYMLVELQLVEPQLLQELHEQFVRLDVTKSGYLNHEDLKLMAKIAKRGARQE